MMFACPPLSAKSATVLNLGTLAAPVSTATATPVPTSIAATATATASGNNSTYSNSDAHGITHGREAGPIVAEAAGVEEE